MGAALGGPAHSQLPQPRELEPTLEPGIRAGLNLKLDKRAWIASPSGLRAGLQLD